jgi:hypothetical protein
MPLGKFECYRLMQLPFGGCCSRFDTVYMDVLLLPLLLLLLLLLLQV